MTREEALKELDQLSRAVKSGPVSQAEVLCPEMRAAARTLSGLRTREKAPSTVRKHQKNRGSVTAARACAARLIAPGAALAILWFAKNASGAKTHVSTSIVRVLENRDAGRGGHVTLC